MRVQLLIVDTDGSSSVHEAESAGEELWVDAKAMCEALGWSLKELGDAGLGICPDEQRCVPVPVRRWRQASSTSRIDLTSVSDALGVAVACDGARAVALASTSTSTDPAAGVFGGDIILPEVLDGTNQRVVRQGRRTAVFAWASW